MTNQNLQNTQKNQLLKALKHLEYSYKKIKNLPLVIDQLDDEILETWESFAARFARAADLFLAKYLRTMVLLDDPGFRGSMRDFINQGEKLGLIDNAEYWLEIRSLRNIAAHEYTDEDLAAFFKQLKQECPKLLKLKDQLNAAKTN